LHQTTKCMPPWLSQADLQQLQQLPQCRAASCWASMPLEVVSAQFCLATSKSLFNTSSLHIALRPSSCNTLIIMLWCLWRSLPWSWTFCSCLFVSSYNSCTAWIISCAVFVMRLINPEGYSSESAAVATEMLAGVAWAEFLVRAYLIETSLLATIQLCWRKLMVRTFTSSCASIQSKPCLAWHA